MDGGRVVPVWYGNEFSVNVKVTDGQKKKVALYFLDWDKAGRVEDVQVVDVSIGAVLSSQRVSDFGGGKYLVWDVSGSVKITLKRVSGPNAVLSGVFVGEALSSGRAENAREDLRSRGDWVYGYGKSGVVTYLGLGRAVEGGQVSVEGASGWAPSVATSG